MIFIRATLNFDEVLEHFLGDQVDYHGLSDDEQNEMIVPIMNKLGHRMQNFADEECRGHEVSIEHYCVIDDSSFQVTVSGISHNELDKLRDIDKKFDEEAVAELRP